MKSKTTWHAAASALLAILAFWAVVAVLISLDAVSGSSPFASFIMTLSSRAGDTAVIVGLCALLVILPRSRHTIALPVCATAVVSSAVYTLLKILLTTEPLTLMKLISDSHNAFPSGHAINNAALYTMLTLQAFVWLRRKPGQALLAAAFMLLIMGTGFSRVYLGIHHAGDVLGGWLIGFCLAFAVFAVWSASRALKQKPA